MRPPENETAAPIAVGNGGYQCVANGTYGNRSTAARRKVYLRVRIEPDGDTITLEGRPAWAMKQLVAAGDNGCTPIDNPGPRWSDYVFKLRRLGIVIETIHESHGGPFAGSHARYVLKSQVTIIDDGEEVAG